MNNLLHNIRFYILTFSFLLATAIYFLVYNTVAVSQQSTVLTQLYALVATIYLYVTLLISPLIFNFKNIPNAGLLVKSRRALGVSAFLFVCMHVRLAFFEQLGGIEGLFALPSPFIWYVVAGIVSFIILFLMFATSFDNIIRKMTYAKWKMLHKCVYVAAFLITIHALMLGSHFTNIWAPIPLLYSVALLVLLLLETPRFIAYVRQKLLQKKI